MPCHWNLLLNSNNMLYKFYKFECLTPDWEGAKVDKSVYLSEEEIKTATVICEHCKQQMKLIVPIKKSNLIFKF